MPAEHDLTLLLRHMRPELHAEPYGFALGSAQAVADPFALIAEDEGMTVIARLAVLEAAGMAGLEPMARISLTVHSALTAVGLTAAIAGALAAQGISANVVAGFHHDHVFLPWDRRGDAMAVLRALSGA
ncbi:MAG: ACT domain-containing protein [Gemmobacter sp.]